MLLWFLYFLNNSKKNLILVWFCQKKEEYMHLFECLLISMKTKVFCDPLFNSSCFIRDSFFVFFQKSKRTEQKLLKHSATYVIKKKKCYNISIFWCRRLLIFKFTLPFMIIVERHNNGKLSFFLFFLLTKNGSSDLRTDEWESPSCMPSEYLK